MRLRIAALFVLALALSVVPAAIANGTGAARLRRRRAKKPAWKTLRGKGGFSIEAPRGYRLKVDKGGYEIALAVGRAG